MVKTNILDEIIRRTKARVEKDKKKVLPEEITGVAYSKGGLISFEEAIRAKGLSFICEIKKASPSGGVIDENLDHIKTAQEYVRGGASAISVLTEPFYFLGNTEILSEVKESTTVPVLQKDFIVDEYQIYQARAAGADAILLICSVLEEEIIKKFLTVARSLGMEALVETHNSDEIKKAIRAGAAIVGVNNRNLKTLETDIQNSIELGKYIPEGILFVSESGIDTPEDIRKLQKAGADGVLIGHTLIKSRDREKTLGIMRGEK